MKKLNPLLSLVTLVVLMVALTGCASKKLVLHPLTDKDIYKGKVDGDVCFSEYYLNNVLQAKIEGR